MLNLNNEYENISHIQINDKTYKVIIDLQFGDSGIAKNVVKTVANTLSNKRVFLNSSDEKGKTLYTPFMLMSSEKKISILKEMCMFNGISVKIVELSDRELLAKI